MQRYLVAFGRSSSAVKDELHRLRDEVHDCWQELLEAVKPVGAAHSLVSVATSGAQTCLSLRAARAIAELNPRCLG